MVAAEQNSEAQSNELLNEENLKKLLEKIDEDIIELKDLKQKSSSLLKKLSQTTTQSAT